MIKLLDILFENNQVNLNYFQQILNQSGGLSISNRKYFQDIINSIKKQGDVATPKQFILLQKLKKGNFK